MTLVHTFQGEKHTFKVIYEPQFRIEVSLNGEISMIVNAEDSLMFESYKKMSTERKVTENDVKEDCFY